MDSIVLAPVAGGVSEEAIVEAVVGEFVTLKEPLMFPHDGEVVRVSCSPSPPCIPPTITLVHTT
jgi:hypothetical protein